MQLNGWSYDLQNGKIIAAYSGDIQIALNAAPLIEGEPTVIEGWKSVGEDHYEGRLNWGGSVHLAVQCGHVCYWLETDIEQFDSLTYFPGSSFKGKYWQTYMSDEHDRKWDVDMDQEVGVSTAYDGESPFHPGWEGGGMTDPGDEPPYWIWNVPVRAWSFLTAQGWAGFSIPGALPVGLVRMRMERGEFSLDFDVLRPSCREGTMPRVYIVTGLIDAYDLLDEHRAISDHLGLTVKKNADHPSWWANPWYKYWDEYQRQLIENRRRGEKANPLTIESYQDWLNTTKRLTGVREMNVTLEQGCFDHYGHYRPVPEMGSVDEVRNMVDRLRDEGTRVGHYINPFVVNAKCEFAQEHPEAFCTPKDPSSKAWWPLDENADKPEFRLLDWTHPLAREFTVEMMRFLYSSEPGCLNCDIVRSNNWHSPDPRVYEFNDPDWGIGDLMTYKVQRFIYETAKQIKPDCMVSKVSAIDPYMQPTFDVLNLPEEWNGCTDNWYRRGRIATRTMPEVLRFTDAWYVTLTKGYEYYMGLLAWNFPETETVRHTIHPYGHYREFTEKDFKRRSAGFHAYMNAPLRTGEISRVNLLAEGDVEQWRKRTTGTLAGFYAAIAIGKRTLITYSETEARVATSVTRTIDIPLPPSACVEAVEAIGHDGTVKAWNHEIGTSGDGTLRMHVEDCEKEALYYRIRYSLTSAS